MRYLGVPLEFCRDSEPSPSGGSVNAEEKVSKSRVFICQSKQELHFVTYFFVKEALVSASNVPLSAGAYVYSTNAALYFIHTNCYKAHACECAAEIW